MYVKRRCGFGVITKERQRATISLGVRGTIDFVPSVLAPCYGWRTPMGLVLFARLRPSHQPAMDGMAGMPGMH